MLHKDSHRNLFIVYRGSRPAIESPNTSFMFYDPNGSPTEYMNRAAKFTTLDAVKAFIARHGIQLDEFSIIGTVAA